MKDFDVSPTVLRGDGGRDVGWAWRARALGAACQRSVARGRGGLRHGAEGTGGIGANVLVK